MSKYCGKLGFVKTVETERGIYEEQIVERTYKGDVLASRVNRESPDKINGDITVNNRLSIVGDSFFNENAFCLRYATWMGVKWNINSIEVLRPRMILSLGGVYNETES